MKTHGGWIYTTLDPSTYVWTSPHGYHYRRDPTGTTHADPTPDPGG